MSTRRVSVTQSIAAPVEEVWTLLASVRRWPRWGPFTASDGHGHAGSAAAQALGVGSRDLQVAVTSPDAPYWLRYRTTAGAGLHAHTAEITLSAGADGRTELRWSVRLTGFMPDIAGLRRARLAAAVAESVRALAAHAEDPPTTRIEWAARTGRAAAPRVAHPLAA